jgi:uncharacterized membrane protein YfcA
MNKFNNLKPEVKAILALLAIIVGGYAAGALIYYINPEALTWIAIVLLTYSMYTMLVSYFKFSTGVDKLSEKYEDKK